MANPLALVEDLVASASCLLVMEMGLLLMRRSVPLFHAHFIACPIDYKLGRLDVGSGEVSGAASQKVLIQESQYQTMNGTHQKSLKSGYNKVYLSA